MQPSVTILDAKLALPDTKLAGFPSGKKYILLFINYQPRLFCYSNSTRTQDRVKVLNTKMPGKPQIPKDPWSGKRCSHLLLGSVLSEAGSHYVAQAELRLKIFPHTSIQYSEKDSGLPRVTLPFRMANFDPIDFQVVLFLFDLRVTLGAVPPSPGLNTAHSTSSSRTVEGSQQSLSFPSPFLCVVLRSCPPRCSSQTHA